jgi:hypothetical protein
MSPATMFDIDAWCTEKLAPDGELEDGCHPQQALAIKQYLSHEVSAQEAAHALAQPVLSAENPNEELPCFWSLLTDALLELPPTDLLIELIQTVERLPPPSTITDHGRLWGGLPGFAHQYADGLWEDWRALYKAAESPERKRIIREDQIRKAAVEACLVAAGLGGIPIDWGYDAVANALERSDALFEVEVPVAVEWLNRASRCFEAGAAKEERSWALEKSRDLWQGESIMTHARYSFWAERLDALQPHTQG